MDSFVAMNERRKRTWAQAQELMNTTRKDRGFFSTRTEARNRQASRPSLMSDDGDGTPKNLRARVRQENGCFRCKKDGHWKAQCTEEQPARMEPFQPRRFCTLWRSSRTGPRQTGVRRAQQNLRRFSQDICLWTALQVRPREPACMKWEQQLNGTGLWGVRVHTKMVNPKGVGGAAHLRGP